MFIIFNLMKMLIAFFCSLLLFGAARGQNDTNKDHGASGSVVSSAAVANCKHCIVLAEQSQARIAIADVSTQTIIWEWKAARHVKDSAHIKWFSNPSDAKVVYNGRYVLMCASGGGVALIRIADHKTVFYAYAGGNTHSAELLPDGNIVSASSTGHFLTLFAVDTLRFPDGVYSKQVPIDFGHNVVWDRKNDLLWSAAGKAMKSFIYNGNCTRPDLILKDSIPLPGKEAHDLFPVYGENAFWFTNTTNVYRFDVSTKTLHQADVVQTSIKSVSNGPREFPVILSKPKESWWTDEVIDATGKRVFYGQGLKIYKARWVVPNPFSYPKKHRFATCQ